MLKQLSITYFIFRYLISKCTYMPLNLKILKIMKNISVKVRFSCSA